MLAAVGCGLFQARGSNTYLMFAVEHCVLFQANGGNSYSMFATECCVCGIIAAWRMLCYILHG